MAPEPATARLQRITRENIARLVHVSPETGVFLGVSGGRGLPPMGEDGIRARMDVYRGWLTELRSLERDNLDPVQRLDIDAFAAHFELYSYLHEDLRRWRHNPDAVSPLGELFFVLLTEYREHEEERFEDLLGRLQDVPRYLDGVRSQLTVLDETWADIAQRVCERMSGLWQSLAVQAAQRVGKGLARDVQHAAQTAAGAVDQYRDWLVSTPPREPGLWVLSDDQFDRLLELKRLGMDAAQIEALGTEYLHEFRRRRARLARSLTPDGDVAAARRLASADRPATFDDALAQVVRLVDQSRAFVEQRALAPMPDTEELTVLQTPDFFVPIIPFAAMLQASVFAPFQRSVYLVTPPADGQMMGLCEARFSGIAVHEGYPGHHLQHVMAHRRCSVYRNNPFIGFPADGAGRFGLDLVEGWAHYCEEMIKDHGFLDSPSSRFWMVEDQLFRAVRILVDVGLSRGHLSPRQAAAMLVEEVGMNPDGAAAEVRRYTTSPTYQLSYLLGKHLIEQLRDAVKQQLGVDDAGFHDRVLGEGSIPVEMIRERLLGDRR